MNNLTIGILITALVALLIFFFAGFSFDQAYENLFEASQDEAEAIPQVHLDACRGKDVGDECVVELPNGLSEGFYCETVGRKLSCVSPPPPPPPLPQ